MRKRILTIVICSSLLFSCSGSNDAAQSPDAGNSLINTGTKDEHETKATVSPNTDNEATEAPDDTTDAQSGETSTNTDFSASGSTLTQSGN